MVLVLGACGNYYLRYGISGRIQRISCFRGDQQRFFAPHLILFRPIYSNDSAASVDYPGRSHFVRDLAALVSLGSRSTRHFICISARSDRFLGRLSTCLHGWFGVLHHHKHNSPAEIHHADIFCSSNRLANINVPVSIYRGISNEQPQHGAQAR